ncbi:MAG: outer membrane lipoprotein-sorting protein [Spirochaetes bacterium]|nr:outer membrane lipoprotein-sorting protein [Spirochaetota bacterium]
MKRTIAACALAALLAIPALAQDAAAILAHVDSNEGYSSISYKGTMTIEYRGKRFVKTFESVARGRNESWVEFTNPEDRGTRYLKRDGRLYVWSPDTEEVMLISGHLLKESMMGSDLSYEDTIDSETLSARYVPALKGTEDVDGRKAYVLELIARKKTESYPKQVLWVDAETLSVLRFELYALSGARLKDYRLVRSELIGGRFFPVEFEMRDLLRKGSRTVFAMREVQLDVPLPDSAFSMRRLEQ